MKSYVIRNNSSVANSYAITVPRTIVDRIPEGLHFAPELTEEGILYRVVGTSEPDVLPSWAKTARKRRK